MNPRRILLVPMDPVHDIGIKFINKALVERGYTTRLLPPDRKQEEILKYAGDFQADVVMISRTLGYGVEELLSRLVDLFEASGLRDKVSLIIGGMAIKPELAQELGFDAGFGPGTDIEEIMCYLEGREYKPAAGSLRKKKTDMTAGYTYRFRDREVEDLLKRISEKFLSWCQGKTSPGVERARLRKQMMENQGMTEHELKELREEYTRFCAPEIAGWYREEKLYEKAAPLSERDRRSLHLYVEKAKENHHPVKIQHEKDLPLVFIQYGTGCPSMDIAHIKGAEDWGADGVVHFDPSWNARTEGLLEGFLTHQDDGSLITPDNLMEIKKALNDETLWQVRAHRGLNTPETVVLAGHLGADLTKINIAYGCLGAGTDPERLAIDAVKAMQYAAGYNMPFDVVTNEELCGVPAYKAFAGMLIGAYTAIRLGAKPILQPLFCYSPEVMVGGQMEKNYVDFNAAKIMALREIMEGPIWPGAPIGFLTHTEDRVQASTTTALHAALASSLGVEGISISSSDEAYSGGPITSASRIDTLKSTREAFRFFGECKIEPTSRGEIWKEEIIRGIKEVLAQVDEEENFVQALYRGVLGSVEDGVYPGRAGCNTVLK